MVLLDVLRCRFVHRQARTILKTYSESSFPDGSNDTNSEAYSELRNRRLKTPKRFARSFLAPETAWIVFFTLNDDCSTQDRPRDLTLVSLEPSGNRDSEYVFKIFIARL